MSTSLFISYRREDSAGYARALYNRLATEFGAEHIFMDVDAIAPGIDFTKEINKAVGNCDAMLAIIGNEWLTTTDSDGVRRIDAVDDYVRIEIANALKRDILVVPVLIEDTEMPPATDLPDDLKPLAKRNALKLSNARFDADTNVLIEAIRRLKDSNGPETGKIPRQAARRGPFLGAGLLAIVLAAGWFVWTSREANTPPARDIAEQPSADTPPVVPDEPVVAAPPVTPAEPTVDTPAVTPSVSADAPNPHLPITLKERHDYKSERWGDVDATVSDGRPAAVRGTFHLKSEHAVRGIKAYVLVQLLDKRGNVIKEVKARTWVSGKFVPNRSEHTVNFDEEIPDSVRLDVVEARLKFVHEQ